MKGAGAAMCDSLANRTSQLYPLECSCGQKMKIIAFIVCPYTIRRILFSMGLPTEPPQLAPARDPPQFNFCQLLDDTEDGFSSDIEPEVEYAESQFTEMDCQLLENTSDGFLDS